jgi:alcohol dehydrogenase (cytochrome c)
MRRCCAWEMGGVRYPCHALVVATVIAVSVLVAACGGSGSGGSGSARHGAAASARACTVIKGTSAAPGTVTGASWSDPNGDLANTRDAVSSTISAANVSRLKQKWSFKLSGAAARSVQAYGSLTAAPIVTGGGVYIQDLDSDVYAISLATGKLRWEYRCDQPELSGPGPNGVAVAGGRVYGLTPTTAFALDAATGHPVWTDAHLLRTGQGTFGMQPAIANDRVYLGSQYGPGPGGGVLIALDAATGAKLWTFNTVTGPEPGVNALGVGAGGVWETPLVSSDGSVTFGIGNPYQTPAQAIARPARILYTDSDVNLNAATGKLRWYYQGVPDDFKDYDMQTSPIATTTTGHTPVVIGSGKMGIVYEMNAKTGRLRWKTPIGEHNGHDDDGQLALTHHLKITAPYTIAPGSFGGVLTNLASAGTTVYAVTMDLPLTYPSLKLPTATKPAGPPRGEIEALSLATGKVKWDTKLPTLPVGAATISNNLVFTTLYNGVLVAVNRATGAIVSRTTLPASTNSPIAIAGGTVIVPAGNPKIKTARGGAQVDAYTVR